MHYDNTKIQIIYDIENSIEYVQINRSLECENIYEIEHDLLKKIILKLKENI